MGWSWMNLPVKDAIERARTMELTSWSTGLPRRIVPTKVVRAEIREDHERVVLYYHNPQAYYGYRGKGDNELFQEFERKKV